MAANSAVSDGIWPKFKLIQAFIIVLVTCRFSPEQSNQRTNGSVNAHLISGPTLSTKTNEIGQSQPRVIIYINFVELESPMLHAKFQDHRTSGSGEEDF